MQPLLSAQLCILLGHQEDEGMLTLHLAHGRPSQAWEVSAAQQFNS